MREIKEIVAYLQSHGEEKITVAELDRRLAALGYERQTDMTAIGPVRCSDGVVYTGINYGVREIDTKMRAFHVDARRDSRFKELQEMRRRLFCVVSGRILTV